MRKIVRSQLTSAVVCGPDCWLCRLMSGVHLMRGWYAYQPHMCTWYATGADPPLFGMCWHTRFHSVVLNAAVVLIVLFCNKGQLGQLEQLRLRIGAAGCGMGLIVWETHPMVYTLQPLAAAARPRQQLLTKCSLLAHSCTLLRQASQAYIRMMPKSKCRAVNSIYGNSLS